MNISLSRGDQKHSYDCCVQFRRSQHQMSKLPTQEALGLHPFCFENQSANPRHSSHLVPQSDQVDLLDWNRSLPTFRAEIRLCLVTNRPSSNVSRGCREGGLRERFGRFLALIVEEAIHRGCWEDKVVDPQRQTR